MIREKLCTLREGLEVKLRLLWQSLVQSQNIHISRHFIKLTENPFFEEKNSWRPFKFNGIIKEQKLFDVDESNEKYELFGNHKLFTSYSSHSNRINIECIGFQVAESRKLNLL